MKEEESHSIRIRALKRPTSIGMSKSCTRHQSYAVIDPGADMEVIGGVGWHALHFSDKSERLGGALEGMESEVLPSMRSLQLKTWKEERYYLDSVMPLSTEERNSHHLRANKIQVSDVTRDQGGDQCIRAKDENRNWIKILIRFNGDIMPVNLREPTEDELLALRVNWLTPPMEKITPQSIR